jgi:hypothetical protein
MGFGVIRPRVAPLCPVQRARTTPRMSSASSKAWLSFFSTRKTAPSWMKNKIPMCLFFQHTHGCCVPICLWGKSCTLERRRRNARRSSPIKRGRREMGCDASNDGNFRIPRQKTVNSWRKGPINPRGMALESYQNNLPAKQTRRSHTR